MPPSHLAIIRHHCHPLEPIATNVEPMLPPQHGIRCVLFDVYGTLLISAIGELGARGELGAGGELGTGTAANRTEAMAQALDGVGLQGNGPFAEDRSHVASAAVRCLTEAIEMAQQQACRGGVDFPEVDILAIWQQTLQQLADQQLLDTDGNGVDIARLAVEYEMRINPTWPMPGVLDCLQELSARHKLLGIVSNAQFFTELLFPAFFDRTPGELGFDPHLQFYSYQHQRAKPGRYLYELAARELSRRGVPAGDVLYIGNDMLNDVAAASQAGFRTALYAGDRRSLRLRSGDDRIQRVQPDLVVTHLRQLMGAVE